MPGWIGDAENPAGSFYSQDNIDYHLSWLDCALNTHGVEIDYMGAFLFFRVFTFTPFSSPSPLHTTTAGVWNERGADPTWTIQLRAAMDAAGYLNTRIVSADSSWGDVVGPMTSNPAYAAAVDIVGAHYPGAPPAAAYALNKTLFASEMWDLGKVDDWSGAEQLMQDLVQQAQWGLSSSILWCLIFSWYAPLPFSHPVAGTNAGAGHSILTAAEPWSGNYQLNPQIFTMAHHTQFAEPGWMHLPRGSPGMGSLPGGGGVVTRYNPRTPGGVAEFSLVAHTVGAGAPQTISFALQGVTSPPATLNVWKTNSTHMLVLDGVVADGGGGVYTATLQQGSFYTLTTTSWGGVPAPSNPIPPSAPVPFPYADDFEGDREGAYAKYFCDEGGAFVVAPVPHGFIAAASKNGDGKKAGAGGSALFQLVTKVPIVWEKNPDPYTLIGNFNDGGWTDYTVSADLAIDPSARPPPPPPGPTKAAFMATCASSPPTVTSQTFAWPSAAWPSQLQSAAFPGQCLGTTGSTLYPGALDVGLQPCASAPQWAFDSATKALKLMGTSSCLDVLSGNTSAGTRVIAYTCKGNGGGDSNQQWATAVSPLGGGGIVIKSDLASPSLCLDLETAPPAPPPPQDAQPYVFISMRIDKYERNGPPPSGYTLRVASSVNATVGGAWALQYAGATLAQGVTAAPVVPGVFHTAAVSAQGQVVVASWDGVELARVTDSQSKFGMCAVGSGWHSAWFDNFKVTA